MTWRESTRSEIREYYRSEFPEYRQDVPEFIRPAQPKEYAIAFRSGYPTVDRGERPFIRRSTRPDSDPRNPGKPIFDSLSDVLDFITYPAENDPLDGPSALADPALVDQPRPVPAALYYAADMWNRSWLLWVDIDAKDIAHERAVSNAPDSEDPLTESGIKAAPPAGYSYEFQDIDKALEYGFEIRDIFRDVLCGEETMVVYSGQGCHVYLLDDDLDHQYDEDSREVINHLLTEQYDIPIDTVVTADRARVARLPYSLHSDVSRIVTPIKTPEFDYRSNAVPEFLPQSGGNSSSASDDEDGSEPIALEGETE